MPRCPWTGEDPLLIAYHDEEWGVPVHDDRAHLELLALEGAQAGLSWRIVLAKRAGYRRAFHGFDPGKVAEMSDVELAALREDPSVVRHGGKLASVRDNARAMLELTAEHQSFDAWVWDFVDGEPAVNRFRSLAEVPAATPLDALSVELRRRGFRFVGPTIAYAYLQAAGLVVDHLIDCPRWRVLGSRRRPPSS